MQKRPGREAEALHRVTAGADRSDGSADQLHAGPPRRLLWRRCPVKRAFASLDRALYQAVVAPLGYLTLLLPFGLGKPARTNGDKRRLVRKINPLT